MHAVTIFVSQVLAPNPINGCIVGSLQTLLPICWLCKVASSNNWNCSPCGQKEGTSYDKHQAFCIHANIISSKLGKESDQYLGTFLT